MLPLVLSWNYIIGLHDDVIKWKHFPRYWPFVRGIHRWPVNSPHKGQWRGALMFSLICAWINGWVNNGDAGDLRRHHAHYDVTVMIWLYLEFASNDIGFKRPWYWWYIWLELVQALMCKRLTFDKIDWLLSDLSVTSHTYISRSIYLWTLLFIW